MAYKTMLLHLNDELRAATLMEAAFCLAGGSAAHVVALYVMPSQPATGYEGVQRPEVDRGDAQLISGAGRADQDRVRKSHQRACKSHI